MTELETLRARVKELEAIEQKKREELRNSVKPVYKYTVKLAKDTWTKLFAEGFVLVRVWRETTNLNELRDAGHFIDHGGGMTYVYSERDGCLVVGTGGGLVLVTTPEQAVAIGQFLKENPEGGDITHVF